MEADHGGESQRILICQGPRCRLKGAWRLNRCVRHYPGWALIQTACLGFCPRGPIVVLYPKGVWLASMRWDLLQEILEGRPDRRLAPRILGDRRLNKSFTKGLE